MSSNVRSELGKTSTSRVIGVLLLIVEYIDSKTWFVLTGREMKYQPQLAVVDSDFSCCSVNAVQRLKPRYLRNYTGGKWVEPSFDRLNATRQVLVNCLH